jgi:hypothetical protein
LLKNESKDFANAKSVTADGNDIIRGAYQNTLEACKKREHEIEDVMRSVRSNYRFKASTNGILIILGTILIASPITFTWLSIFIKIPPEKTNMSYFLGGIGIVAFVTTFFKKPQRDMTEAIGDLAQLFMICIMYKLQYRGIAAKLMSKSKEDPCTSDDIKDANLQLYTITEKAGELVDKYVEKHAREKPVSLSRNEDTDKRATSDTMVIAKNKMHDSPSDGQ